jgi:hypothetical protein
LQLVVEEQHGIHVYIGTIGIGSRVVVGLG